MQFHISDRWRRVQAEKVIDVQPTATETAEKKFYEELILSKPALIDEKVKLHGQVIDEFNLSLLDKMSPEELRNHVKKFVADYVVRERVTLNQKELESFT